MLKKIGITGGVGCGKSEIMRYLKEHYPCSVLLADDLAKELKMKGQVLYDRLVSCLGTGILNESGEIDNRKMAAIVFKEQDKLNQVNAIMHPVIREEIKKRIRDLEQDESVSYFFLEAALLIEEHYKDDVLDELWYIYADEKVRTKRLKKSRGYTDEKIRSLMDRQLSEEEFCTSADFVIDNNGSRCRAFRQIRKKMKEYRDR